jgi:hypothetical protein
VPGASGDRPCPRPGEDEDPPRELRRRPNHEAPERTASRPRDRAEPAAGRGQAGRIPGPARRRPALVGQVLRDPAGDDRSVFAHTDER